MFRLFSYLAAAAVSLLLISSSSIFWVASSAIDQSKQKAVAGLAWGVSLSIASQIDLLNKTLDQMAQDAETVRAVASQNPALLASTADRLTHYLPNGFNIRLLLPGITDLDDKVTPPMTYADLNMVRETLTSNQNPMPAIQGDSANNRHLAIARKIVQNNQNIGVLLASFDDDFIHKSVWKAQVSGGYIQLHQAKLLLGTSGLVTNEEDSSKQTIRVANTNWELSYGLDESPVNLDSSLMLSFILIPMGVLAVVFLFGYRKLSTMLTHDLGSVMKAFKDMMKNKFQGNYPTELDEMKGFISTLSQYKRILDHDGTDPTVVGNNMIDDDLGFSGFSSEATEFSFDTKPANKEKQKGPENLIDELFKNPALNSARQKPAPNTPSSSDITPARISGTASPRVPDIAKTAPSETNVNPKDAIFRAYDIRGIVGSALTQEIVYDIGRALGTEAKARGCQTLVIGRDGRISSPGLAQSLANGIVTTGCNILDIGMVPTPVLYFVAYHVDGQCGIMITGSHNPADYNGIKMVIKGETLAEERIQSLKKCIEMQSFAVDAPGNIEKNSRYGNEYIGTVCDDVHLGRPMKIVIDCGNGVVGDIGPKLFRTLGCEVIELYCEINGAFPNHHPDPSKPENLEELIMAVKHYQADLGLAFDGDGDRLGVVDSKGRIIWPDRQMMLYAQNVLAARPGSEVIFDVTCSRHLSDHINKCGGRPLMWKSGHSLMKAKLQETGAALAGEMSGHIFFNDRWFGFDDALYTAARLIEIISEDIRTSAEIFAALPDSTNTPELSVPLAEGENFKLMENLLKTAKFPGADITTIDGLRVDFPEGFGLVRASNTTPSLVIRFEADSREALMNIQQQFGNLIKT
ncbi:MAG: phosphomannomutase/phosphoglucomutase, partial [Methylococcaceae bacterium]|nr:phosphomannomutase/phosphoglucomutase [Methylococcaceae bacterium]